MSLLADLAAGAPGPKEVESRAEDRAPGDNDEDLLAVMDEFRGAKDSKTALESMRALVRLLSK